MRRPLALAAALLFVLPAAGDEARIKTKVADARAKSAAKEHRAADLAFAEAAQEARAAPELVKLAEEADRHRAENLLTWADAPNASPADRQFACNNLGVLLLRAGNRESALDAVKVYERVREPTGAGAYLYLANHARALEKAGRAPDALRLYGASLRAEPRFALAAERAASLLVNSDAKLTPAERRAGARALLGAQDLPAPVLRSATVFLLSAWKNGEAAEDVLPFVVRYLALSGTTAEGFARNESEPFAAWESSERLKGRLVELRGVYESLAFAAGTELLDTNIAKALPAWAGGPSNVPPDFARLLAAAGDGFARRASVLIGAEGKDEERAVLARQAAQRYALAATLSADDTRSLVAAVGVVIDHRDQLDPNWKVLDRYAQRLFDAKNSIYMHGKLTGADYRSLGGLHVALANILEAKGERWGEGRFGALSVEFQLKKAIWVEGQLWRLGPGAEHPASPELRERLARACEKAQNRDGAAGAMRDAADLYLTLGNTDRAAKALARSRELRPPAKGDGQADGLAALVKGTAPAPKHDYATQDRPRAVAYLSADLIGVGADGRITGWKFKEGEKGKVVSEGAWTGTLIAAAPKTGDFVCSADAGGVSDLLVDWWRIEGGRAVQVWPVVTHAKGVRSLAISPDGKVAASLDAEGQLKVTDINRRGEKVAAPFAAPRAVAFRKPGELVIAGRAADGKGALALVSLGGEKNGKSVWTAGHAAVATAVAVSDDERFVAVGCADGTVAVFDAVTGKPVKAFGAHPGAVRAVAFVPGKSRLLATIGSDQAARLWLAADGHEVARFGNPRPPVGLSFSPDGKLLALALDEFAGGRVRVWEVPKVPAD